MSAANQAASRPLRSSDFARPIFVFDTECDLNHAVPREIAWCIMTSNTGILATYAATIARHEHSRSLELLPYAPAPSPSSAHSFTTSKNGDVVVRQQVS